MLADHGAFLVIHIGVGQRMKGLLKLLAIGAAFGRLLVDGDEHGAQESGDGHVAAGGGEAGVAVKIVGDLNVDEGHGWLLFWRGIGERKRPDSAMESGLFSLSILSMAESAK
jgi:hypothetical protein